MKNPNPPYKEEDHKVNREESFMLTFITTFGTVFLAEIGDKTQIATLLLSAGSAEPLLVFIGAALALISTSLIGVVLGRWLSDRVPENLLNSLAGIIMLGIGLYLISEISFSELNLLNYL